MQDVTSHRTDVPDPAEFENLAVHLATGAARIVRDRRSGELEVTAKSTSTDLVTEVDRATERWLLAELAVLRPGDAVLGEETGVRTGQTGVRWVLDPIDGTVNFVLGLPQYAVSVAAEIDGAVVAGAVCQPISGETFHARRGGGAFLGDERLDGPRDVPLARAVVGTGFSYDPQRRALQVAVLTGLLPRIADVRRLGAASLDLCFVAAGRLDAFFEVGLNPWDYAAGGLIATEAGCVVTGLRGRGGSPDFLAVAGARLVTDFVAVLEELDADVLSS
jgi:myo-inositol-1(or 4)-monophosphatase